MWIALPGLEYDEALFVMASYPRDDTPVAYTMHFHHRPVALMIIEYLGALKGWLYIPLFKLWRGSAALARVPMLLIGAASLYCLYLFSRQALGWEAALVALALTATDPTYLFTTRMDWGPVVIQRFCLLAGCSSILLWWKRRRLGSLAAGFFAMGVGIFDKATFLWLIAALALSTAILFPRQLWASIRPKPAAVAAAALWIGAAPFVYYNWKWKGATFRHELDRKEKYAEKLRGFAYMLHGTVLVGWFTRDMEGPPLPPPDALGRIAYGIAPHEPQAQTLMPPAIVLAVLLLPAVGFHPWGRAMLFALLACLFSLLEMLPIRNAGAIHHLALLLPFPQIFVASGFVGAAQGMKPWLARRGRLVAAGILWLFVVLLVAANLRVVAHYYFRILGYGGGAGWSEAIYSLERSLEKRRPQKVVLLDWGMMNQLRLLSGDRLPLREAAQPQSASYDARYLQDEIQNPGTIYVKYAPGEPPAFPQIAAAFQKLAAARGYRFEVSETIRDRRGRAVYEILLLRPAPAPGSP